MDKASILGDTIEYVKQLKKKIQELEMKNKQITDRCEEQQIEKTAIHAVKSLPNTSSAATASNLTSIDRSMSVAGNPEKKKRVGKGRKGAMEAFPAAGNAPPVGTMVQVSIIESDALLELECNYRDVLLLDILKTLIELKIEVIAVHSSSTNGVFKAEIRAKVLSLVS